ncbi:MAG: hypothetical protein QOE97_2446 [Pseudonocardiales bacterium]|nr:hypothetical protein [Pseudonocardiales bacterium]
MTTSNDTLLVWQRPIPSGRPGAAALSPEEVAAEGVALADREGLHTVSVKRVASKLNVPLTRVEGYLRSREDLLDLMLDAALGEIELPPRDPSVDWRADLSAIAHATQAAALRHPWLRSLAGTRIPCGPAGLRHTERVLEAVDGMGLDPATATHSVNTVLAFVYGFVQLEMGVSGRKDDASIERRTATAHYLMDAIAGGEYPALARVFSDASISTDDAFEKGLGYVLDGVGLQIERAGGAKPGETGGSADATAAPRSAARRARRRS